ncbi:xanthine dehydrogenase family protein molybdopterin-binding subunit [Acidimangrovimonas sediminis]|uniref:xanthine dehydrogenase family protein molybdopterin-binding subunit n=1 Tax=Acidimangrovimonas sediminis TaxID=2056283 RepID=UPI000C80405F|nr:xanthine dehydrogenase family protein molybdopterin-binding subunit [Acidimangrovimonas sediminis]
MNDHDPNFSSDRFPDGAPQNLSRRRFLLSSAGVAAGALVIGVGVPVGPARAAASEGQMAPGTNVPAFLEIRPDNRIRLQSPFNEGGQGVFTAMAQIVGEELDADPESFIVENAPAGHDYLVVYGKMRITGGSMSVRTSYDTMRKLGAMARDMLLEAAATRLNVPKGELSTEPGQVVHKASGQKVAYGDLAGDALDLAVPDPKSVALKDPKDFRWIRQPLKRLDVYEKSTGRAVYAMDCKVDGMLHAAVQHAPRLGLKPGDIANLDDVKGMKGVHSVHKLDGAVAVVAERFWVAKLGADALQVDWQEPTEAEKKKVRYMPADFSTEAYAKQLAEAKGDGDEAESHGDIKKGFDGAAKTVTATYHSQYVHHAQLEPAATLARFNEDGTLDIWLPNQAPEQFQAQIAKAAGVKPEQVHVNSPLLGGFFGRHFLYPGANPFPQAIALAKAVGKPVKVIWTREQEFLRDPQRPMAAVRFRGALDADGMPVAIEAISATEGPTEGLSGHKDGKPDPMAVEGLTGKAYAIPNRRIAELYVHTPVSLAYWRSVGHSMNDFLYEGFLDEMADAGGKDPYDLRMQLLKGNDRLTTLLKAAGDLSGGWKRGPFTAGDGTKRARGVAMASPFGSEAAAIAEVSIDGAGKVVVHDIWEAVDPGSIVNPAIIRAQVMSAATLGVSQVLMEEVTYKNGEPDARNYDLYPILPPDRAPRIHATIVERGAKMGGVGEPPLPAVPAAIANAVSHLTGKRVRSMPLDKLSLAT